MGSGTLCPLRDHFWARDSQMGSLLKVQEGVGGWGSMLGGGRRLRQGGTDALGGQDRGATPRLGEAASRHVTVTSPQPAPPRRGCGGHRGPSSGHAAGGGGTGWNPRPPEAGGPLRPLCVSSDDETPRGEVCSSPPASRHFARDLSQECPAGGAAPALGSPLSGRSGEPAVPALLGAGTGLEARVRLGARVPQGADGLCPHPLVGCSPSGHYGFARPP